MAAFAEVLVELQHQPQEVLSAESKQDIPGTVACCIQAGRTEEGR